MGESGIDKVFRIMCHNLWTINFHTFPGRDRHHAGYYCGGSVCVRLAGAYPADSRRVAAAADTPASCSSANERIAQRGNLARLKAHGALREPADAGAERLLSQFHAAAVIWRTNEHD